MRNTSFLLSALMLGAIVSALPPAAAADDPCMTAADLCLDPPVEPHCDAQTLDTYDLTLTVNADCTVDLETGQDTLCVGAWYATDEPEVGPVHWTRHYCTGGQQPICCLTDTAAQEPIGPCTCPPPTGLCQPVSDAIADRDEAVDVTLHRDCSVHVLVDMTRIPGCEHGSTSTVSRGPVTVVTSDCTMVCACDPPPQPLASEPLVKPCDLQDATPAPLSGIVWGGDCDVDVEPIGACAPPSGRTIERRVAFVHLVLLLCDGGADDLLPDPWS